METFTDWLVEQEGRDISAEFSHGDPVPDLAEHAATEDEWPAGEGYIAMLAHVESVRRRNVDKVALGAAYMQWTRWRLGDDHPWLMRE